ncbi:MAG: hypothetical protein U1F65_05595 [Verrucomicrobiota bacterium]
MSTKKNQKIDGLEGAYYQVGSPALPFTLKDGKYQMGYDTGSYTAELENEFSCVVSLASKLFKGPSKTRRYRLTRRSKTYTLFNFLDERVTKYNRRDGVEFLTESPLGKSSKPAATNAATEQRKQVEQKNAEASFHLTGESVLRATTIPKPPSSKSRTVVRVTHINSYGCVDSDVYVRLGNPKKPLGVSDFDTVSDWQRAKLVEDVVLDGKSDKWVARTKKNGEDTTWAGTYEVGLQFPKGYSQIELKLISRVPAVCSIVLSNWKVFVR